MKVEKTGEIDGEVELTITATPDEVIKAFTEGLDVFINQFGLGHLEGETAEQKIINALGKDEAREAISSAVISFLIPFALDESGVIPMSTSDVNSDSDPEEGKEFIFTIKILAKPEIELSDYSPVEVSVGALPDVTEADIDNQLHMLASQFATVKVDPETGEEQTIIPEITDEWVVENLKGMGANSVEQLRAQFWATSEKIKQEQLDNMKMNAVLAAWANRFDGEVSPKIVDAMTTDMLETFKLELAQQGRTLEDYMLAQKTDEDQLRALLFEQASKQIIQGLVLDAIFRHEGLEVSVQDLKNTLSAMAPGMEDDVFDQMQAAGRAFLLKEGASRMKAAEYALENAMVTIENRS